MIVLLLTTKDEADLLRVNLEHHLSFGVDHVAVCDNESRDDTQDVVRSFGEAASSVVFRDFGDRQRMRMKCLARLRERHDVQWAGVSDTDELFWAAGASGIGELLAEVPAAAPAVTFHQKLFLPTELDRPGGPACERQLHRAGSYDSPLFLSYREGKTFYRAESLRRITDEHRNPDVPRLWHRVEAVHHYMIRGEDHFVAKVKRFEAWRRSWGFYAQVLHHWLRQVSGRESRRGYWYEQVRATRRFGRVPFLSVFKLEWWTVLKERGEEGLREYYRTRYRLRTADLPALLAAGHVVEDAAFAKWRAARSV